jgi:hypothetical protein
MTIFIGSSYLEWFTLDSIGNKAFHEGCKARKGFEGKTEIQKHPISLQPLREKNYSR